MAAFRYSLLNLAEVLARHEVSREQLKARVTLPSDMIDRLIGDPDDTACPVETVRQIKAALPSGAVAHLKVQELHFSPL